MSLWQKLRTQLMQLSTGLSKSVNRPPSLTFDGKVRTGFTPRQNLGIHPIAELLRTELLQALRQCG
jgi:hypothetical protein